MVVSCSFGIARGDPVSALSYGAGSGAVSMAEIGPHRADFQI
jgi:hypothetical protein